jgi:hypothetical protein
MIKEALFVNFNSEYLKQVQTETGEQNRVAASFEQGLEWVRDASVPLSGIYLNPNHSNSSALQFLGEVMQRRPATPIFILDEFGDMSAQNFSALADKFKIKGIVRGKKDLSELLKPLQMPLPESLQALDRRQELASQHAGYLAVPLIDFLYAKNFSANTFVEDTTRHLRFFAMEGSEVDLEYLSYLGKRTPWLYIEESSVESRMASYRLVESAYLDPAYLSPSWRTAETFFRAKKLLSDLQTKGVSEDLVSETYSVFQNLFKLTTEFTENAGLKNLLGQAKQSDRAIQSIILSVLLCKKLKYEKTDVMETLGVASLLQDVSLYASPFGNISEAHPEDLLGPTKVFYDNHPNLSADLLKPLKVPELTMQIIRQQHERTDRTGFPSKVGGAQLQPLAEVLSLINSYLDAKNGGTDFYEHYSDRVVVPFQQLIAAWVKP